MSLLRDLGEALGRFGLFAVTLIVAIPLVVFLFVGLVAFIVTVLCSLWFIDDWTKLNSYDDYLVLYVLCSIPLAVFGYFWLQVELKRTRRPYLSAGFLFLTVCVSDSMSILYLMT